MAADDPVAEPILEDGVEEKPEDGLEERPPGEESSLEELPVLAVRDTVIFPGALLPLTVGRPASVALVQSLGENRLLAVVSQIDPREDSPSPSDLYQTGTVCVMHKALRVPKDNLLLFCEGIARIHTRDYTATDPFLRAHVERLADAETPMTPELEALRQNVISVFQQIVSMSPNLSDDLVSSANHIPEPGRLADFIAGNIPTLGHVERQQLLEQSDPGVRLEEMQSAADARIGIGGVARAHSIGGAGAAFAKPARVLSARAVEGDPEGTGRRRRLASATSTNCAQKLEAAGMPEEVKTEAMRELGRLARMAPASPEYGVTRTYLEWMIEPAVEHVHRRRRWT